MKKIFVILLCIVHCALCIDLKAQKLGFKRIIIPAGQVYNKQNLSIEVKPVKKVADAFRILFSKD